MIAAEIMVDLLRLGIRLEAHGDRLRYSPRSAMTPELAEQIKMRKPELLAMLQSDSAKSNIAPTDPTAVWQAALDRLEGDPLFPPEILESLRKGQPRWIYDYTR